MNENVKKVPQAQRYKQANYYFNYMRNPASVEPTAEDIKCELQLSALSDFEPLTFEIDYNEFRKEIAEYNDKWVPYLPREGTTNNRQGLCLVGLSGDLCTDSLSIPEARIQIGRAHV